MAKKKSTAPTALVFPHEGKTFHLESKFKSYQRERLQQRIVAAGGTVVEEIDAALNYLVLAEDRRGGTGQSQAEKKAAKAGGAIVTVYLNDLGPMLCPSPELALALLTGGQANAERWQYLQNDSTAKIDLKGADLRKLDLSKFSFSSCDLDGVLLDGAKLDDTQFYGIKHVDFRKAKITSASIQAAEDCQFDGVDLSTTSLGRSFTRCSFRNAKIRIVAGYYPAFEDCDLTEVDCVGFSSRHLKGNNFRAVRANFSEAKISTAQFSIADFTDANFERATLEEVHLDGATLRGANFEGANLRAANLVDADLTNANLRGANLADADLSRATVSGADFTGANLRGTKLAGVKKELATGLEEGATAIPTAGPHLVQLETTLATQSHFELHFTLNGPTVGLQEFRLSAYSRGSSCYVNVQDRGGHRHIRPKAWSGFLLDLGVQSSDSAPLLETVKARPATATLLLAQALCEIFKQAIPENKDLNVAKKSAKASTSTSRDELVAELRKKGGVTSWNARPRIEKEKLGNFDGADFSKADLRKIDLGYRRAVEANFTQANLNEAALGGLNLKKANLTSANLSGARAWNVNAEHVNATDVNLSQANLSRSTWDNATLTNANLEGAHLQGASFLGADLTGANLKDVKIDDTRYDANTKFPAGYTLDLGWKLVGPPPANLLIAVPDKVEMTFDEFFKKLATVTDPGRIRNAVSMLRAEKFSLFAETTDSQVLGVVRSQSSGDRVYACRLTSTGVFECGTQNLRICGGLQGKVCKHLLVLILGLTKGSALGPGDAYQWLQLSQRQTPTFDKEVMATTFLKYKGVETGEVDWRPTETVPEDYYAL